MGLDIFWVKFAENKLEAIYDYYSFKVNLSFAKKLVNEIVDATINLKEHPEIGQKELNLFHRPQEFRYIVHKNYKIVYWINKNHNRIEIVHVFDTRQDPIKINEIDS